MTVQEEIDSARRLGEQLEDLVVRRGQCPDETRNVLIIGYWALIFDYHKGILALLSNDFCGSAFALLRPLVESLVRSYLVVICSEEDLHRIIEDDYRVNFATVGPQIDTSFGTGKLFENFLSQARTSLHSYTHSGLSQLSRRFEGHALAAGNFDLKPHYEADEIIELIRCSTSGVWMVTNLVTKRLNSKDESEKAEELFLEWASQSMRIEKEMGVIRP